YAVRAACRRPGALRVAAAGAALGLALAVKFVALLLLPAIALLFLAHLWRGPGRAAPRLARAAAELAALGLVALLVLNASVAFSGTFAPLGALPIRSELLKSVQSALPRGVPVPVPRR